MTAILQRGAEQLLAMAIENEVDEYVRVHAALKDAEGLRLVVRNGCLPETSIQTGVGLVDMRQPRVCDGRLDERGQPVRFCSKILPPYLREDQEPGRTDPLAVSAGDPGALWAGDFTEALEALLGPQAKGLSATNVVRLKESWQQERRVSSGRGRSDLWKARSTSTCGPTGSTSTSAWKSRTTTGNASWS